MWCPCSFPPFATIMISIRNNVHDDGTNKKQQTQYVLPFTYKHIVHVTFYIIETIKRCPP